MVTLDAVASAIGFKLMPLDVSGVVPTVSREGVARLLLNKSMRTCFQDLKPPGPCHVRIRSLCDTARISDLANASFTQSGTNGQSTHAQRIASPKGALRFRMELFVVG